jgi:hypothetical protein
MDALHDKSNILTSATRTTDRFQKIAQWVVGIPFTLGLATVIAATAIAATRALLS